MELFSNSSKLTHKFHDFKHQKNEQILNFEICQTQSDYLPFPCGKTIKILSSGIDSIIYNHHRILELLNELDTLRHNIFFFV